MQCPYCQTDLEANDNEATATKCPECGASLAPPSRGSRLVTLIVVALLTVAIVAGLVAVRADRLRKQAEENLAKSQKDFALASQMIDRSLLSVMADSRVKDSVKLREQLLKPYLDYYQAFDAAHAADNSYLGELATAHFHIAALQAKLRSKAAIGSLGQGFSFLNRLKNSGADATTFPSVQESALRLVAPGDWNTARGDNMQMEAAALIVTFGAANSTIDSLVAQYPQVATFRSDQAGLSRTVATITGAFAVAMPAMRDQSLAAWIKARNALESLVKEQPDNSDFKTRLVEALVALGKMQRSKSRDEAIANYARAVELREQLVAAEPKDESLKKDLDSLKADLEKLKSSRPVAKAAPADNGPTDGAAKPAEK
jgi:tetratricopeptide (TPR) repeat protein